MQIQLAQPTLLHALQATAPVAAPNPSFPIGQSISINPYQNHITLTAHNGHMYIKRDIPAIKIEDPIQVLVEHKLLYNWVNRCKADATITLTTIDEPATALQCKSGRSRVKLGLYNAKDFPTDVFRARHTWTIASNIIREGLATTSNPRIGLPEKTDGGGYTSGTHFKLTPNHILIEAVSNNYGAFYTTQHNIENFKNELDILLPPKITSILQTALPDTEEPIRLQINEEHTLFSVTYNSISYFTPLVVAKYPDTSRFYSTNPEEIQYDMTVQSNELFNALQTAEMFIDQVSDPIIITKPTESVLDLKLIGTEKGSYEGQIDVTFTKFNTDPIRIGGSVQQLSRITSILRGGQTVKIQLKGDDKTPCLKISGDASPRTFYITMPIKIR